MIIVPYGVYIQIQHKVQKIPSLQFFKPLDSATYEVGNIGKLQSAGTWNKHEEEAKS